MIKSSASGLKYAISNFADYSIVIGLGILFVLIPSIRLTELNNIRAGQLIFLCYGMTILALLYAVKIALNRSVVLKVTLTDAILALILFWIVLERIVRKDPPFSMRFFELICLALLYAALRKFHRYLPLLLFFCVAGILVQAVHGLIQLYCPMGSNNSNFALTGNFFNPGPYAGYILNGFCLSAGIYLYREEGARKIGSVFSKWKIDQKVFSFFTLGGIGLTFLVLVACRSRAAWLAVFVFLAILFYGYFGVGRYFAKQKWKGWAKAAAVLLISLSAFIILYLLYQLNTASADGRFLIWHITSGMISKNPVTGIGYDRFSAMFMPLQADFLHGKSLGGHGSTAGSVRYPFNIVALYLCENGVFFLISIVVLAVRLFLVRTADPFQKIVSALMVAQITFGLFSYPEQILPIKMVSILILAFLSPLDTSFIMVRLPETGRYLTRLLLLPLLIATVYPGVKNVRRLYIAFSDWNTGILLDGTGLSGAALPSYYAAYPAFDTNGEFLLAFGSTLLNAKNYRRSLEILIRAEKFWDNYPLQIAKGKCYSHLNSFALAEKSFLRASEMIPGRFYPRYLLARFYLENGRKEKALKIARDIMASRVKIASPVMAQIRDWMSELLKYAELPAAHMQWLADKRGHVWDDAKQ